MSTRKLIALALVLGLIIPTATAAARPKDANFSAKLASFSALTGPCAPGAAYDPACDVNHDGVVNVLDIQLAAGHFNQNGTFTSDNDHTHLGQTWTGANNPLKIGGTFGLPNRAALILNNSYATGYGLLVESAGMGVNVISVRQDGVYVLLADHNGVEVFDAGLDGMHVSHTGGDGFFICLTGTSTACTPSVSNNGLEVGHAEDYGVRVSKSGADGIAVLEAGGDGVDVVMAADNGVEAAGNNYAGYFEGNIYVAGDCTGCLLAAFGVNVSGQPLQPGDLVAIEDVAVGEFANAPVLWRVVPARPGLATVGVVAGRAESVVSQEQEDAVETRLVPRKDAADAGDYVSVIYHGPTQVAATGEVLAGQRVTVDEAGGVRAMRHVAVEGVTLDEGGSSLGMALNAAQNGLVWVLVNPQ